MNCTKCGGEINFQRPVTIRTSCRSFGTVYPCVKCGLLHWLQGDEVHKTVLAAENRGGQKAYLVEGEIVNKD